MTRSLRVAAAVVLTAVTAGCGDDEGSGSLSPAATMTATPAATGSPAATGTTITTGASQFGTMLFDGTRQAIYLFDKERTATPECYGDCAVAWPPVLTNGPPKAAGSARADLVSTTKRSDGSLQVTYAGHPLYFYAHEGKGEVTCHDVREFGGLWLVVTPEGKPAA